MEEVRKLEMSICANDLVNIIQHTSGKEEINKAHDELKDKLSSLTREDLQTMCIRLVYSVDALTSNTLE